MLTEQINRIAESNPVQGFADAFTGFGDELGDIASEAISSFTGFFTDPQQDGSLAKFIQRLNNEGVATVIGDLSNPFTTWFTNIKDTVISAGVEGWLSLFRSPDDPDSFYSYWSRASQDASLLFGSIAESIKEAIGTWITDNLIQPIWDTINPFLDPENPESMAIAWANLGLDIIASAGNVSELVIGIFDNFKDWVNGASEDGGLPTLLTNMSDAFKPVGRAILTPFPTSAWCYLACLYRHWKRCLIQRLILLTGSWQLQQIINLLTSCELNSLMCLGTSRPPSIVTGKQTR